jgi:class 3 adenylate cyclase
MQAHVLIVDDLEEMRDSLVFALKRENRWWNISLASTVDEAREVIESPDPEKGPLDIVLTDLILGPGGNGIDILTLAKKKDPFIMVIVFTAQEKELDRFQVYKHGAFDCVEKNIIGTQAWREISVKANAAISFRRLALSHVEDQKRIARLQSFFDPRVFQAIKEDPGLLGIKMRKATIVFWDIQGFSKICNALRNSPETLRELMFEFHSAATEVIFQHRGIVDKFVGDSVMALFFPMRSEDDDGVHGAAHAVQAARSLEKRFQELTKKWDVYWTRLGIEPLEVGLGCGMNTGSSLVGTLGTATREQFTALGPTVNFAARLETLAKAGQILVSKKTAEILQSASSPHGKALLEQATLKEVGYITNVKNIPGKHLVYEVQEKA